MSIKRAFGWILLLGPSFLIIRYTAPSTIKAAVEVWSLIISTPVLAITVALSLPAAWFGTKILGETSG